MANPNEIVQGGSGTVTKLIAGSGITLVPPSGRGQVTVSAGGGITATDFLFVEGTEGGVYAANMPLPAGTLLCEILFYAIHYQWAADNNSRILDIGDNENSQAFYPAFDIMDSFAHDYDPTAPGLEGEGWANIHYVAGIDGASILANGTQGRAAGAGVLYPTDDSLAIVLTTTVADPPVVGTGVGLVRVLTMAPVVAEIVPLIV